MLRSEMLWPGSRASFLAEVDTLAAEVRNNISAELIDDLLSPQISDEYADCFFPHFTTWRQPDVIPHRFTRFSRLPEQLRKSWHSRLWTNALGAMAVYDEELREILKTEGPASLSKRAAKIMGTAISKNWGFALWGWAQEESAPDKTFFCFDMLALKNCFVIETVESRVNGKPGGWRLVEEVLNLLDYHGTEQNIPWIHAVTTNPEATKLFRCHGFVDAPREFGFFSNRATPLRRDVRVPSRSFNTPPPDIKHLFPHKD